WRYEVAGSPVPVVVGNVRWLSGYRHPRHDLPDVAAALQVAFAAPTGLMAGAESVGDPIAVLPALWGPGGKPNSPPSPRQSRPWKRPGTRCRPCRGDRSWRNSPPTCPGFGTRPPPATRTANGCCGP